MNFTSPCKRIILRVLCIVKVTVCKRKLSKNQTGLFDEFERTLLSINWAPIWAQLKLFLTFRTLRIPDLKIASMYFVYRTNSYMTWYFDIYECIWMPTSTFKFDFVVFAAKLVLLWKSRGKSKAELQLLDENWFQVESVDDDMRIWGYKWDGLTLGGECGQYVGWLGYRHH